MLLFGGGGILLVALTIGLFLMSRDDHAPESVPAEIANNAAKANVSSTTSTVAALSGGLEADTNAQVEASEDQAVAIKPKNVGAKPAASHKNWNVEPDPSNRNYAADGIAYRLRSAIEDPTMPS